MSVLRVASRARVFVGCCLLLIVIAFGKKSAPRTMVSASAQAAPTTFPCRGILLFLFSSLLLPGGSSAFSPWTPAATSSAAATPDRASSPLSRVPVVICPGFGNDQVDYVSPLSRGSEYGFVTALARRGFDPANVRVLPLKRYEWARVGGGLLDVPDFYRGTCTPEGRGYGWYVRRLREEVERAYIDAGGEEKVVLIGHSAGGWLARAALGDGSWTVDDGAAPPGGSTTSSRASDRVRALITVGAIHRPPAGEAKSTCVTRGALDYVDKTYPGAFLAGEGISYVSVGGDAIEGRKEGKELESLDDKSGSDEANGAYRVRGEGSASSVAYTAYEAVSGDGSMTGDGIVPLAWSLLEGSRHLVLDGVLHSINEAGTTIPTDRWYGSDGVVDRWLGAALEEAGIRVDGEERLSWTRWLDNVLPGL
ncbi:hypothetical protein ACHAWF_006786 [Thalassiosira exigua]